MATLRTEYHAPVAYPDLALGPLLYVKRVTAGVFFDAGREWSPGWRRTYRSYGAEVTADAHALGLLFPVRLGFRAGYETRGERFFGELLLGVSFTF